MSYIDGFVIACPTANKDKFIAHAKMGDSVFMDLGATRVVECWGDDVPEGKVTDFRMAVKAKPDELVVLSWIVYKSRRHRDAVNKKVMADPMMAGVAPSAMPFDGKRMFWGGFSEIVALGKKT